MWAESTLEGWFSLEDITAGSTTSFFIIMMVAALTMQALCPSPTEAQPTGRRIPQALTTFLACLIFICSRGAWRFVTIPPDVRTES